MTAEIAVACVLLVGAGLLGRSYVRLSAIDVGFDPRGVLLAELSLPSTTSRDRQATFQRRLLERLRGLPESESVALAYDDPCSASWTDSFNIPGRPEEGTSAWLRIVSAGYFETMRIPLRSGRAFADTDDEMHPRVALINEAFVRRFFPGENPLGRHLIVPAPTRPASPEPHEIIGIVADVRFLGPSMQAEPALYLSISQFPQGDFSMLLRTKSRPESAVPALRAAVRSIDEGVPLGRISTVQETLSGLVAQARLNAVLVGLFGVLAFLLAALGVFGLLSYTVGQRTREMGVRLALGAEPRAVAHMILSRTLRIAFVGVGIGMVAAAILARLLEGLLFQIEPADPATFAVTGAALGIVSLIAGLIPARRAAHIDPLEALRNQ